VNVLITVPHGSTIIPSEFMNDFLLTPGHMNKHLDFGTEKIFDLPNFHVLKATASRFVVDLNRERNNLSEGQGVIITETWDGEPVLKRDLTPETIEGRLKKYYDPFYKKLDDDLAKKEKPLFVLDGHSMDSRGSLVSGDPGKKRPEICFAIGRDKGTISEELLSIFEEQFKSGGYNAERNNPYNGGRAKLIHYCAAVDGVQALELEVNKAVYMNEDTFELKEGELEKLRKVITNSLNLIKEL